MQTSCGGVLLASGGELLDPAPVVHLSLLPYRQPCQTANDRRVQLVTVCTMEGLGISTMSSSSKAGKRSNGAKLKGKHHSEPPTTYTVSKIDAGQAVLISDQVGGHC